MQKKIIEVDTKPKKESMVKEILFGVVNVINSLAPLLLATVIGLVLLVILMINPILFIAILLLVILLTII